MKKRYSHLIRPLFLMIDILIINLMVYSISDAEYLNTAFLTYISLFWFVSSFITGFYKVYRFTKSYRVFPLLVRQFFLFILGYFTYFGIFREGDIVGNQTHVLASIIFGIVVAKFLSFYVLKKYRSFGKNYRNVVVIGEDDTSKKITKFFQDKKDLGYRYIGFFSDEKTEKNDCLGNIKESASYILKNDIDEVYCVLSQLKEAQVKEIKKASNQNNCAVKLIPNANELYNKNVSAEFYHDSTLILNVKKLPFELSENHFIKRLFDIFFSIFVCVFVLSWLVPVLWVLIKLESKGPVFFKQKREGLNGIQFVCYKFRSMSVNKLADVLHATKEDVRITKIGAFLRKTSLDELPQFFNVLKGNMSVVGPRPHMNLHSQQFEKEVRNYIKRYAVKPGITGLAQVSGYRGEIQKKADIKNRVRLDIFYIENWSFLLDLKIITQTFFNAFSKEDKAY